jgi:hypothetical protein
LQQQLFLGSVTLETIFDSFDFSCYTKLFDRSTKGSKTYNKPILAVNPFGQQKKSGVVLDNADKAVGWNKKPVISAIWNLYRG